MHRLFVAAATLSLLACDPACVADPATAPQAAEQESGAEAVAPDDGSGEAVAAAEPASQPTTMPSDEAPIEEEALARPPSDWVEARVSEARERLAATEAGRLIWESIEAHGGLNTWYTNGPISFRFNYMPVGDRGPNDTFQTVDTWSSRAFHHLPDAPETQFGWDGEQAWVSNPEAELGTNPRFWTLTPYYFVAIPFVLADPGVTLTMDGEFDFEGVTYPIVRATFGEGVGDAPDDYYRVLVHPQTKLADGVFYVVSYPGFYPDGGHGAEKLMVFDGQATTAGITLPEAYRTFALDQGMPTDLVTNTTLSDVSFDADLPDSAFAVPEGATVLEGY